jgi:hypothetical protein
MIGQVLFFGRCNFGRARGTDFAERGAFDARTPYFKPWGSFTFL